MIERVGEKKKLAPWERAKVKTTADQEELKDNHELALGGKCVSTYRAVSVGVVFFFMIKKNNNNYLFYICLSKTKTGAICKHSVTSLHCISVC